LGSRRASRKEKERKVKSWAAEEQKGKKSKLLGSGRACRKIKVSLGQRRAKRKEKREKETKGAGSKQNG
jgi:hypothetical protein